MAKKKTGAEGPSPEELEAARALIAEADAKANDPEERAFANAQKHCEVLNARETNPALALLHELSELVDNGMDVGRAVRRLWKDWSRPEAEGPATEV